MNTYCEKLWDELYIDYTGDVYSCCHQGPEVIGNIYNESMDEIINKDKILEFRKMSLDGNLKCYESCTLQSSRMKQKNVENNVLIQDKMHILKILYGELCNINCIMCWQDSNNTEILDFDKLKQNIQIERFEQVIIQGGEPLFCNKALDFFDFVSSKGVKISFLTNGILINDIWAEKIALNSIFIHISINAATKKTHELINKGSDWDMVLANVQLLRKYKKRYNSSLEIKGHMTIVEQNLFEIGQFIRNFEKLGFDFAKFGFDSNIPSFLDKNPNIKRKIILDIHHSINKQNIKKIDIDRLKLLGLF